MSDTTTTAQPPPHDKGSLPPPVMSRSSSEDKDGSLCSQLWVVPSNVFSRDYLMTEVDPARSTFPMAAYCFMTGFIDAICFSAIFVWCAFQTGNTVQLALALARLFEGPPGQRDGSFHLADKQALTSVTTFLFGAFLGRIGDKMGPRTRLWLFLGTFLQTLFTMSAAVCIWKSHSPSVTDSRAEPVWENALSYVTIAFMSASMGLQGIMGKRVNTQFATTIVLTTVWCELVADPKLFKFNRLIITRDHKILAIAALFVGGFAGRAILDKIGSSGALGVGTGIRLLISLWWLFVPGKTVKK